MDPRKIISEEQIQKYLNDENIAEPIRELLFYLLQKDQLIFDVMNYEKQQFHHLLDLLEKKEILSKKEVKKFRAFPPKMKK